MSMVGYHKGIMYKLHRMGDIFPFMDDDYNRNRNASRYFIYNNELITGDYFQTKKEVFAFIEELK